METKTSETQNQKILDAIDALIELQSEGFGCIEISQCLDELNSLVR